MVALLRGGGVQEGEQEQGEEGEQEEHGAGGGGAIHEVPFILRTTL